MPAERIAMRQVRDEFRLNAAGGSGNEIACRLEWRPPRFGEAVRRRQARLAVAARDDRTLCWKRGRRPLRTAAAPQRRKIQPDLASAAPVANPVDRITNKPKLPGSWRSATSSLPSALPLPCATGYES
jgi:hypothetical protein